MYLKNKNGIKMKLEKNTINYFFNNKQLANLTDKQLSFLHQQLQREWTARISDQAKRISAYPDTIVVGCSSERFKKYGK